MPDVVELIGDIVTEDRGEDEGMMMTARLVPFGEVGRARGGISERFEPGALAVPEEGVPLTVVHPGDSSTPGGSVLERIGWLVSHEERADGHYGTFRISDTAAGRDTHALMRDRVARSVSVGFIPGESTQDPDGTVVRRASRPSQLDHVAVVPRGAYAGATPVAVRQEGHMPDIDPNATPQVADADPATEDRDGAPAPVQTTQLDVVTEDRMRSLEALVAAIANGEHVTQERRMPSLGEAARWTILAARGDEDAALQLRALATDDTTSAAGLVPSYYSQEIISIVDAARPFVDAHPTDPIGDHGMDVVYPKVTQKPTVGKQASEGAEVASQEMQVGTQTVTLDTFAGANAVSIQLIERSSPAFVGAFYRELAGIYAQETEQEAEADVLAAATGTAVLADLGASASATQDAFILAAVTIAKAVKRMPSDLFLSPDRWGQLAELRDTTGRPLLLQEEGSGQNQVGQLSLRQAGGSILGLRVVMVPNFATATAIMAATSVAAANLEQRPVQLQAMKVSTLEWELGVYGYYALAIKHAAGYYDFTAV